MQKTLAAVMCGAMLGSCASAPDRVSANYVSPQQYGGYDCTQVRQEMFRVSSQVRAVSGAQSRDHTRDAVAMGVGLVLFWPALFFLAGGNHTEELATLKGQYDALNEAAIEKHCSAVTDEMAADQASAHAQQQAIATQTAPALPTPAPARRPCAISSPTDPSAVTC